jgi:DNA-binding NtrC family response regulator
MLHHARPRTRLALRRGLEAAGFDVRVVARPEEVEDEATVLLVDAGAEAFLAAVRAGRIRPLRVVVLGAPADPPDGVEILPASLGPSELAARLQDPAAGETSRKPTGTGMAHAGGLAEVEERVERLAGVDLPVLVTGESGSGKEVVARALHERGRRAAAPFVVVDPGAIPDDLVESELFGHVRGAFTDAVEERPGRLALAGEGTLVLDEVGELPLAVQARLLRVLQERSFHPVGGTHAVPLRARLVATTRRDLGRAIAEGRFREDLYHRLAGATIHVPPLRERPDDVAVIAGALLARQGEAVPSLTRDAVEALRAHAWPGNVRELDHVLQRCRLAGRDPIDAVLVETALREGPAPSMDQALGRALRAWITWQRHEGMGRASSERSLRELFDRLWDDTPE